MNKNRYKITSILICAAILLALLGGCGNSDAGDMANIDQGSAMCNEVIAHTPYGKYIGLTRESGVISYLGIPFAKQPIGDLRWKEPQPLDISTEIFRAYDFGKTAVQPIDEFERASFAELGEDCLSLNVWTKDINGKKPTMVFLHGGANVSGGSSDPLYHGENFVANNDVVMVTINYRLGPFGFLDLSEVGGKDFENSRNAGILDQIAALKWVKENIENFGGDAKNITVFGESAGGSAIIRLMATPLSEGLFQKAIIESGGPASLKVNGNKDVDEVANAKKLTKQFMEVSGVTTLAELQQLTATEVQYYADKLMEALGDDMAVSTWGPSADGDTVPFDVFKNIKDGTGVGVKILIGTNADEMNYFKLYDAELSKSLEEEYESGTTLGRSLGTNTAAADRYMEMQKDNPQRYIDFAGECWLRQPSIIFAELQSKHNEVYMYEWQWKSNIEGLQACHAVELAFVFGNFHCSTAIAYSGENLPDELARKTQASWTAFAATGDPSISEEIKWPRYDLDTRATMFIDNVPWRIVNDPKPEARKYLRELFYIGE